GQNINGLDHPIGQQQSMLQIQIRPAPSCVADSPSHEVGVFRMNSLKYELERRFRPSITSHDSVRLGRPLYFSGRRTPATAPGVAQRLRSVQVRLHLLRVSIQTSVLQGDRRLRSQEPEHRYPGLGEHVRGQAVLQVEHADEFGPVDQWQAENRTGVTLTNV